MKIAVTVARVLLGLMFTIFGANGFLHFIPMTPATGLAGQFTGAMFVSHYLVVVFLVQLIGGLLLLSNRFVPLALTLLGPVIVNILCFHVFMSPDGIAPGILAAVLWFVTFAGVRSAFAGIFQAKVSEEVQL